MNKENPFEELTKVLIAEVVKHYRVSPQDIRDIVIAMLQKDRRIPKLIAAEVPLENIQRLKAFKTLRHSIKKRIYYHLRRYKPDNKSFEEKILALEQARTPDLARAIGAELAAIHASTRERFAIIDQFHRELFARIGTPHTILDAGCGVYPLLFPWEESGTGLYLAIDKDPGAIRAVTAFAGHCAAGRLVGYCRDISDRQRLLAGQEVPRFDICFMFKLIPVVGRHDQKLLANLAQVPAQRLVVTGSKIAMAKKRSIERRERLSLLRFAKQAGRSVLSEWCTGEEICLLLE